MSRRDLGRLVDGLSLVGKEVARSQIKKASSLREVLLTVTDLVGFTSGKVREFPSPHPLPVDDDGSTSFQQVSFVVEEKQPQTPLQPPPPLSSEASSSAVIESSPLNIKEPAFNGTSVNAHCPTDCDPNNGGETQPAASIPTTAASSKTRRRPRERRVPDTPFSRALGFAGLGAGLAWGTVQESTRRLIYGTPSSQDNQSALSPFLSPRNAERLALALCRMRGAALKLGQMLSIQDESIIPAPVISPTL